MQYTQTQVKERPILFSGEMVRAILDGRKTQTRRLCKPGPPPCQTGENAMYRYSIGWRYQGCEYESEKDIELCPYGKPGDRLYVRETWNAYTYCSGEYGGPGELGYPLDHIPKSKPGNGVAVIYEADGEDGPWRPSIHMPRWASRILLEITDLRVERLQDISEDDARAEGFECDPRPQHPLTGGPVRHPVTDRDEDYMASEQFADYWDSINGKRGYSWASNPLVWVITFRSLEQ